MAAGDVTRPVAPAFAAYANTLSVTQVKGYRCEALTLAALDRQRTLVGARCNRVPGSIRAPWQETPHRTVVASDPGDHRHGRLPVPTAWGGRACRGPDCAAGRGWPVVYTSRYTLSAGGSPCVF